MAIRRNKADDVMWAADTLKISERQLFRQAYLSSHSQAATNDQLDVFYTPYCRRGTAPVWVTRFARQVLSDQANATEPRKLAACSPVTFSLELAIHLFIRPHSPETLGPDRYRTLVA